MNTKIKTLYALVRVVKALKKNGKKIVFTNGCFDIIHVGHTRYLKAARKLGDVLIIAVNSDASVKRLKGPGRPVNNENDRMEILSEFPFVDLVVLFNIPLIKNKSTTNIIKKAGKSGKNGKK